MRGRYGETTKKETKFGLDLIKANDKTQFEKLIKFDPSSNKKRVAN